MSQFSGIYSQTLATAKLKVACVNATESEQDKGRREEIDLHHKGSFLLVLQHKVIGQSKVISQSVSTQQRIHQLAEKY